MSSLSSSTTTEKRILDALQGAFVADAACMGTHWIYNPQQMKETVPSLEEPEFKTPPTPNFYSSSEFPDHYGPGMLSPYGEQLLFVTEYCAKNSSGKDALKSSSEMSTAMKKWAETFGGRPDHAMTTFLQCANSSSTTATADEEPNNAFCGADDDQAHCFTKAVAVTCLFAGAKNRHEKVEMAIRVHQDNDTAVAFGLALSNIINALLLGSSLMDALAKDNILADISSATTSVVKQAVDDAYNAVGTPLEATAAARGRSCHLPESFIIPLQAALNADAQQKEQDSMYISAIRENILASGDTCSRAIMMGAILAVAGGGCPTSFHAKIDKGQSAKVDAAAAMIAAKYAT